MKISKVKDSFFCILPLLNVPGIVRYSLLLVLHSALVVTIPFLSGAFIDALVYGGTALGVFLCLAGSAFTALLLNVWTRGMIQNIARRKEQDLQLSLLLAFQSLKPGVTNGCKTGEVAMKFFRDTGVASIFLSTYYPMLLGTSTSILLALVMVLCKNPLIALLYLVFLPLMLAAFLPYTERFRHLNRTIRTLYDNSMNKVFEFMLIFPFLKSMDAGERHVSIPGARFRALRKMNLENDRCAVQFEGTNKLILFLGEYSVLGVAGWLAWKKHIPVGDIVTFQMLFLSVLNAFSGLFQLLPSVETTAESVRSMNELLKSKDVEDVLSGEIIPSAGGDISIRHLSFRYPRAERRIFEDFSCEIKGGSVVAVTGANGTGKTTFLHLITGDIEPQSGSIVIAGKKLAHWQKRSFRRKTASVFQDSLLITGTIRDNITLKNQNYSEAEIADALRLSGADSIVKRMPDGLDHPIGGEGGGLSGGERQKIAIARALIRRPDILIFDEVVNHLDYQSRMKIRQLIVQMRGKMTIFLATHDPDMRKLCDQEICLKETSINGKPRKC